MSISYKYETPVVYDNKQFCRHNKITDPCDICDAANITDMCDKCGSGVCCNDICGLTFPHKYNTTYIVCATCVDQINKKLIPLIDLGKIELLKSKIRNNCTTSSIRSSSMSSSSGSSISSDDSFNYAGLTFIR